MQDIFVKVQDNTIGPLSPKKIRSLIDQGVFTAADKIWSNSEGDWVPAGTAAELKMFFSATHKKTPGMCKITTIASGKGGVGKTVFTASLGVGLAALGRQVTIVDADFGGANLHTAMGILQPEYNFADFFSDNRKPLSDFVVDTPVDNLTLISGAGGSLNLAGLKYYQKQRFIRALRRMPTDHLLIDLGGGSQYNVIDFFLQADEPVVLTTPELPAVQEAFAFIKMALLRCLAKSFKNEPDILALINENEINRPGLIKKSMEDIYTEITAINTNLAARFGATLTCFRPKLVLNKRTKRSEEVEAEAICEAALDLLSIEVEYLGHISYDERVAESIQQFKPLLLHAPVSRAAKDIKKIIQSKLVALNGLRNFFRKRKWTQEIKLATDNYPDVTLVDEVAIVDLVK